MNPALWAAIIAANAATSSRSEPYVDRPWWAEKSTLPRGARFLLWLIRRRTSRRLAGRTYSKLDDWLWDRYFKAIDNYPSTANPAAFSRSHA